MKKTISILLLACMCLLLAACGSAPKIVSQTAAPATAAPATAAPAEASESEPAANSVSLSLAELVDSLNAEQSATEKDDDPIHVRYDVGGENKILYKFTMDVFEIFVMMAEAGDEDAISAYNDVIDSLPDLYTTVNDSLQKMVPGVEVEVRICTNMNFDHTIAAYANGALVFDKVNKIGSVPADDAPSLSAEEVEQLIHDLQNSGNQ